jgi:ATP-dependent Clp protease ATP-binding subunit ClpA
MSDLPDADIFEAGGRLRPDVVDGSTAAALREALAYTRATNWDSVRTPHVFMGLLAVPDPGVQAWADRLGANLDKLLDQFRELFHQDTEPAPRMYLNREFLSDNVLRLLRDAYERATDCGRDCVTSMDLLVTTFSSPNSIVAECFERVGVTAAHLTELAMQAEEELAATEY